jgi:hypothetical protein
MKLRVIAASVGLLLALGLFPCAAGRAAAERMIDPGTPAARHALRLLSQARRIYTMNSQSWTATNPTLDRFYRTKLRQVDFLIDRLRKGVAVPLDAVDDALDSQDAARLGGHPMPLAGRESL